MEITTEEAQAVLLGGMEGTQYITIQRADADALGKGVPLLTLNGDLLPEGMVVDMISAGVSTEYGTTTQYYEADDLLPHELTEVIKYYYYLISILSSFHIISGGSKISSSFGRSSITTTTKTTTIT